MKKALSALALAFLTFCPLSSPAADMEQLEQLVHQAFGHQERMCVAIDALNREIALHILKMKNCLSCVFRPTALSETPIPQGRMCMPWQSCTRIRPRIS